MSLREWIAVGLLVLGLVVTVISVIGLFQFRDPLDMIHAGALADTLGLLLMLAGLMVLCGFTVHTGKLALTLVVLWSTNPVSAHLMARMELITGRGVDPDELPGEGEQEL